MTRSRGLLPARHVWREGQLDILREFYPKVQTQAIADALHLRVEQVSAKAHQLGLHKDPGVVAAIARERSADPNHPIHRTGFKKGLVPANKGVKRPPGWSPGNMAATQFQKGQLPHTTLPIGATRINPDGYLERKFGDEPGPYTRRWKTVHRLVWEAAHGAVPKGHVLSFKPGRRTTVEADITLDALELLTQAQNLARNSIHHLPPELVSLVQLRGVLNRMINQRSKSDEQRQDDQ